MLKLNVNQNFEDQEEMTMSQLIDKKYNLVSIADTFLTQDQLKQKRIQKMQMTAHLIREEKRNAQNKAKQRLEELKKSNDKNQYMLGLYQKRKDILDRMANRTKKKEDFGKRGTQQAHQRMQKIVELGKEDKPVGAQAPGQSKVNKDTTNDDFGL